MNKELLLKVADKIEADARSYDQHSWYDVVYLDDRVADHLEQALPAEAYEEYMGSGRAVLPHIPHWCDTHACIAGHAAILADAVSPVVMEDAWTRRGIALDFVTKFPITTANGTEYLAGSKASVVAGELGRQVLDLPHWQSDVLFGSFWKPLPGMTAADALRAFADGQPLSTVSDNYGISFYSWYLLLACERMAKDHTNEEVEEFYLMIRNGGLAKELFCSLYVNDPRCTPENLFITPSDLDDHYWDEEDDDELA